MKGWKGKFRQLFPRSEFWKIRAKRLVAVGWIPKAFDFSMEQKTRVSIIFGSRRWSLILRKTTGVPAPGPENVDSNSRMCCLSLVSPDDWWLRGVLWWDATRWCLALNWFELHQFPCLVTDVKISEIGEEPRVTVPNSSQAAPKPPFFFFWGGDLAWRGAWCIDQPEWEVEGGAPYDKDGG